MLQTALDLSKQWPLVLLKLSLGMTFIVMVITMVYDSDITWMDALHNSIVEDSEASLIYTLFVILGFCFLIGSLFTVLGEAMLLGFDTDFRVKLAADVFDTGNGLLIQQYQEVRRNSQLYGGLFQAFFWASITIWLIALLGDDQSRLLAEVYYLTSEDSVSVVAPIPRLAWWQALLSAIIFLLIFAAVIFTIREMTRKTFVAIAVEVEVRKNWPMEKAKSNDT